jgi:hypothetical protein
LIEWATVAESTANRILAKPNGYFLAAWLSED